MLNAQTRRRLAGLNLVVLWLPAIQIACGGNETPPRKNADASAEPIFAGYDQVERCVAAYSESSQAQPGRRASIVFERCKGLYRDPKCAAAWEESTKIAPDKRLATLAYGCAEGYCPKLDQPRPTICQNLETKVDGESLLSMKQELFARILVYEWGPKQATRIAEASEKWAATPRFAGDKTFFKQDLVAPGSVVVEISDGEIKVEGGEAVPLPDTSAVAPDADDAERLLIPELKKILDARRAENEDRRRRVYYRADRKSTYFRLTQVLYTAGMAGFEGFQFLEPENLELPDLTAFNLEQKSAGLQTIEPHRDTGLQLVIEIRKSGFNFRSAPDLADPNWHMKTGEPGPDVPDREGQRDWMALLVAIEALKKKHPSEIVAVLAPEQNTTYDDVYITMRLLSGSPNYPFFPATTLSRAAE